MIKDIIGEKNSSLFTYYLERNNRNSNFEIRKLAVNTVLPAADKFILI